MRLGDDGKNKKASLYVTDGGWDAGAARRSSSWGPGKVNSSAETYVRRNTATRRATPSFLASWECDNKAKGHVSLPLPFLTLPFPFLTCPLLDTPDSLSAPPSPGPFPQSRHSIVTLRGRHLRHSRFGDTSATSFCPLAWRLAELGHRLIFFFTVRT